MATLFRQSGSAHWWIRYSKDGKQVRKSTGTSDRDEAQTQLHEVEVLLDQRKKNGTVSQHLAQVIQAEAIHPIPAAEVFKKRREHIAETTKSLYLSRDTRFLTWLARNHPQVNLISDVDRSMVSAFLAEVADLQEPRTHNGYLRRLRTVFTSAVRDGYALQDPTAGIPFLQEHESPRRPFTEEELKRLFGATSGDVNLLATMGLYAGALRLSDIINLTWGAIDIGAGTIRWRMHKRRGKHMEIAIHPSLGRELAAQRTHRPSEPLFHTFHGHRHRASEAFRKALVAAKLKKDTRPDNNRRYRRRKHDRAVCEREQREYVPEVAHARPKDELDFHSLRYNFVSILKKQGCPEAIARSIMGHSSVEVSAIYTHIDDESERKWVTSLPDVLASE